MSLSQKLGEKKGFKKQDHHRVFRVWETKDHLLLIQAWEQLHRILFIMIMVHHQASAMQCQVQKAQVYRRHQV